MLDGVVGITGSTWNDVRVEAIEDEIKLYINDVLKGSVPNTDRPILNQVNVYANDSHY